jgi:PAS domain S-box-containing protein
LASRSIVSAITESKDVEELKRKLESQRIQHNALINSLDQGLAVIGPEGNIRQVNSYALEALGFAEDEIVGRRFSQAIVAVDDMGQVLDPLRRPITEAFIEGRAVTEYTNLLRKDGTSLPVALTAAPIIIDNKPAGAIDVFRDLTRERQLDLAKNDFVSLASHQLRTPATGVKAILHMIISGDFGPLSSVQKKYLQRALENNERQLDIIEDLLNVARADAGALELTLDYLDVSELVRAVALEHREPAQAKGHTIVVHAAERIRTLADGQKLAMVIDNLVSNAIKYTSEAGRIIVRVEQSNAEVHISVSDQGIGINHEDIAIIFDKFARVQHVLSSAGDGTGLGLYLARQVIYLHNGNIQVTSTPGKGSTFRVSIPKLRKEE